MRIGLLGLDSSRPVRVVTHLRDGPAAGGPHDVVAVATEGAQPSAELTALVPHAAVVGHAHELLGRVDAVIDVGRRAPDRRARLVPLLEAGVHVLADKPLATTAADASALVAAARRGRSALAADSGYRQAVGPLSIPVAAGALEIAGPADLRSPWGGLAFYGIHHAQLLDELVGIPPGPRVAVTVAVTQDGAAVTASLTAGRYAVRLRFDPAATAFTLTAGDTVHGLTPPPDYLERLVDRFLVSCASPRHDAHWARRLGAPVELVERVSRAAADQV